MLESNQRFLLMREASSPLDESDKLIFSIFFEHAEAQIPAEDAVSTAVNALTEGDRRGHLCATGGDCKESACRPPFLFLVFVLPLGDFY